MTSGGNNFNYFPKNQLTKLIYPEYVLRSKCINLVDAGAGAYGVSVASSSETLENVIVWGMHNAGCSPSSSPYQ